MSELELLQERKEKHQRRLSYISLIATILMSLFVLIAVTMNPAAAAAYAKLEMLFATFVVSGFGLPGAYVGIKTMMDIKNYNSDGGIKGPRN